MKRFESTDAVAVHTVSISGESLGAMTAGTVYEVMLQNAPILDSLGRRVGGKGNSSLSFTGSVFTNEVGGDQFSGPNLLVNNGDYYVDYTTGYIKVKAGASATPTVSYKIKSINLSLAYGGFYRSGSVTVTTGSQAITFAGGALPANYTMAVCFVVDGSGNVVHYESSVTSLIAGGFTINPVSAGTLVYLAIVSQ